MSDRHRHPRSVPEAWPLSRRASLLGVAGSAVASMVPHAASRAGKAGKKARKTCKRQIGQCQGSISDFCANPQLTIPQEECEAGLLPCCPSFRNCKAGAAYDCIADALLALVPPETPV
jgi:hypothetical protein